MSHAPGKEIPYHLFQNILKVQLKSVIAFGSIERPINLNFDGNYKEIEGEEGLIFGPSNFTLHTSISGLGDFFGDFRILVWW